MNNPVQVKIKSNTDTTQRKTERGFAILNFIDRYNRPCSLQKSSLATENCIWLGADDNRMHLTQELVKMLLPHLIRFTKTGEI